MPLQGGMKGNYYFFLKGDSEDRPVAKPGHGEAGENYCLNFSSMHKRDDVFDATSYRSVIIIKQNIFLSNFPLVF